MSVTQLPGTTAGTYQWGATGTNTASPWTNAVAFELSSANANKNDWYCEYGSTLTDTGVAVSTSTFYRLSLYDDGTNLHWYVNGTQVCGTGVANGSLPTNNVTLWSMSAVGSTSTSMNAFLDYVFYERFSTGR